ncbi:MAG: hypothetical protein IJ959_01720, partial [Clostridia bacterium]|nr:hypothetical protein [Clostridia bacterium]
MNKKMNRNTSGQAQTAGKNASGASRRKMLKILGAGGLAFFMGVGTLCGVLIAPMGATSASNAGNLASAAQSADSALTPQEKLLAGTGLGLDPENDPVVFTT